QEEDGIRDLVTGVQTCALPICACGVLHPCLQRLGRGRRVPLAAGQRDREVAPAALEPALLVREIDDEGEALPRARQVELDRYLRSEERRVGKECRCRARPDNEG